MSFGVNPPSSTPSNPNSGVSRQTVTGKTLTGVFTKASVNQIRGINFGGATGQGIPRHVSGVSASISNAQAGSTNTVKVLFTRDPSDAQFSGVTVYITGYQGNGAPVQVASGTESPISFVLNNTGESISIAVQATGNGGSAPMTSAPTTGVRLPNSAAGGFGDQSNVAPLSTLTMPAEFNVNQSGGSITVTKADEQANTVWAGPASGSGAGTPTFRGLAPRDIPLFTGAGWRAGLAALSNQTGQCWGTTIVQTGANMSYVNPTSAEPPFLQVSTTSSPNSRSLLSWGTGSATTGQFTSTLLASFRFRFVLPDAAPTNIRMWACLTNVVASGSDIDFDAPNGNLMGFRYSTYASDSGVKCVCQTSNVNKTVKAGIALDTNPHEFEIRYDGTNWLFLIDNALKATFSAAENVPLGTVPMSPVFFIGNGASGAAVRSFRIARWTILTTN